MASNSSELDTLRSALEAARSVAEEAQAAVDNLIGEQAELPQRKQRALEAGDGATFALLQQAQTTHPARLYFAQVTLLKAQQAVTEAEHAVIDAEMKPLLAKHEELTAAMQAAMAKQAANGNEIDNRRRRVRTLIDLKRRYAEKLFALQTDFEHSARLDTAPVVRSLIHAH